MIEILNPDPPEKRQYSRRATDHTPEDCHKLLNVQSAMDGIHERLDRGSERMDKIEESIRRNHEESTADRAHQREMQEKNNAVTDEIREILEMGKGFFRMVNKIWRAIAWLANWIRKAALWLLPVATAILSFWYAVTSHINPPK
jgi:hypothetical protein